MDANTQRLLVEVCRTVLRVLDVESLNPKFWTKEDSDAASAKWKQSTQVPLTPRPVAAPAPSETPSVQRNCTVRVWDGHMFVVGTVQSVSRDGRTVSVAVSRGEGRRRKIVQVAREKAEFLRY